ncbi:MAG TPA: tetratricopeptide repeat protein, partial [Chthonomonadaceae bacterium]|nr:tetratricopeptide repeat protein [Chthonomonadaceae bacterium]
MDTDVQGGEINAGPILAKANLARVRGDWPEAIEACISVLRSQPGNANAHSLLGDIYRDQGLVDDAIQWYRMAADLRPAGPDVEKLRKLEARRERSVQNATASAAATAVASGNPTGGTSLLMGYSPTRWLHGLTIASACFLAAIIVVLIWLRPVIGGRGAGSHALDVSSRPMVMPTAESGMSLPRIDPNRPTVVPLGQQPAQPPAKPHIGGEGLEPDRGGGAMRGAPAKPPVQPAAAPQASAAPTPRSAAPAAPTRRGAEVPPAPVQLVSPLRSTSGLPSDRPDRADRAAGSAAQPGASAADGAAAARDAQAEREPPR